MPQLRKALENIGLDDKEIRVLMVLLENGPMFVASVARAAKLNRTTTYGILKELSEKGLASSAKKEGGVRYQSIAPELLPRYIERRGRELLDMQEEVIKLVPQLKLLRSKGQTLPKVQFFEGAEGVKQAYEDTLENNKEKFLRDITGIDAAFNYLDHQWIKYYLEKRTRLGIKCIDIVAESDWGRASKADDEKYLRTTKFIPKDVSFASEVSIYDNKVGIFSYAKENPVAILIEDDTIAHTMKQLFDYMESTTK